MSKKRGHCLCGQVSFEYDGPENWRGHCHCESCRRNTSSAFSTFMGVPCKTSRFTGAVPAVYESSPGVRRLFCANCGTPMAYESDRYPDEIHFYAASLENPGDFEPDFHVHFAERLPWADINDGLPRHDHGGGA
ncbi:GFA family protein [Pelagibius sp. Alg239-R121]|uniref:GFA family protein n=1 Tax=Pelagibius sp. Alg239-R121 TaxID=2993448 RepID=UPI0024A6A1BD|nr:GFA family protein [Pelagibius sp. Alg239-R121]